MFLAPVKAGPNIFSCTKRMPAQNPDLFARPNAFALGVCNGRQMLTRIAELIPGTNHWPLFLENQSKKFEARVSMVKV
jgi:phosphoribosylformylglycinamidine (FGAM) synthase-like amidotransferase family enzyme